MDGSMDLQSALREVLKQSLVCDGLVHGIHQSCKVLDKWVVLNLIDKKGIRRDLCAWLWQKISYCQVQTEVKDTDYLFPPLRRQAVLCILSDSCDEPQYKQLITALCNEHQIPLLKVDSSKKLGEWSGLCKIDKEGKPRKICGCSCVVIKNYGQETPALDIVKQHLRS